MCRERERWRDIQRERCSGLFGKSSLRACRLTVSTTQIGLSRFVNWSFFIDSHGHPCNILEIQGDF